MEGHTRRTRRAGPHWTARWLGRPWREDEYECAAFALEVLAAEFGLPKGVTAPQIASDVRRRDLQLEDYVRSGMVERVVGLPDEGDLVLMRQAAGRRLRGYHIGLLAYGPGGEGYCLHLARGLGSVLTQVPRLEEFGYAFEGYYRWA